MRQGAGFQSTHPHGVRHLCGFPVFNPVLVSIHAPAWGATQEAQEAIQSAMFQSTHPHGVRRGRTEI